MLLVLILANLCSLLDRSILSLLIGPIKEDLGLSNTEFGWLQGLAFAVLYSLLAVPIGRLVDQYHRVRIITAGILVWSTMTALCGAAWNFTSLFLARVGVGVGEATLNPAAYSLLSDCFPRRYLARAIGGFVMSTYAGIGLSYVLGGLLVGAFSETSAVVVPFWGEVPSWKLIFVLAAAPGLLIAAGVSLMPEPRRTGLQYEDRSTRRADSAALLKFIDQHRRSLGCHFLAFVGVVAFINGLALWTPTFLHQAYGLSIAEAGLGYGLVIAFFGGAGPLVGGWISDTLARRNFAAAPLMTAGVLALLGVLPSILFPWISNLYLCYVLIGCVTFIITAQTSLAITALQIITPNELRGQVSAVFLLFVNLFGMGCGPVLVPFLSDHILASPDLRLALSMIGCAAFLLSIVSLGAGIGAFRVSEARSTPVAAPAG